MKIEFNCCSGGMAEGARRAGIRFDVAVDHDPNACASYEKNLGHRPICMDMRDFVRLAEHFGAHRRVGLLVADPPCTPWSRAGKRKGLDDERDMLRVTAEIIGQLRPECWLLGNVPGLDDEPNWPIVQGVIGGIGGYCIDYARFDAADYGVPQHRVRPFWFGHPTHTHCIRWPSPTHGDPREIGHPELGDHRKPWVTCGEALAHLPLNELGQSVRMRFPVDGDHQPSVPGSPAKALTANTHCDGAVLAFNRKHPSSRPNEPAHVVPVSMTSNGGCVLEWPWDRPATSVTTRDDIGQAKRNGRDGTPQSWNAIKLSERAGAILQGFPDGWVFAGRTKKDRWSQIGQATPPGLAEPVFRAIVEWQARRAGRAA